MARIKIEDIPEDRELSDNDLDQVAGGILIGLSQPSLFQPVSSFGSFSISKFPLPGVTVAGVRG